ncbi:hypothetical protein B0T19DRAFT_477793 [Cercophora scortea]|uniref:Bromo domain-containing protein n=1 Tax=Cercophora scortea TaxID=314031 RepID=A0AAE0I8L8_9PEZI|nr:hypothetical protein B0T19DRAFT_477793 [Cercophora scortea]
MPPPRESVLVILPRSDLSRTPVEIGVGIGIGIGIGIDTTTAIDIVAPIHLLQRRDSPLDPWRGGSRGMNTTTPTSYTPLESLLLFRGIASYGLDAPAFVHISENLRHNALIGNAPTFDAARLTPESLQALFLHLLWEELRADSASPSRPDGGLSPTTKKRRLQPPPIPTLKEARQHVGQIESVHRKLQDAYIRQVLREIQQLEHQYDQVKGEIEELEEAGKGKDGDDAYASRAPNGTQDLAVKRDPGRLTNGTAPSPRSSAKPPAQLPPQQPPQQPAQQPLQVPARTAPRASPVPPPTLPTIHQQGPLPPQDIRNGPSSSRQGPPTEQPSTPSTTPAVGQPQAGGSPQIGGQTTLSLPVVKPQEAPSTPQVLQPPQGVPSFQALPKSPTPQSLPEGLQRPEGVRQLSHSNRVRLQHNPFNCLHCLSRPLKPSRSLKPPKPLNHLNHLNLPSLHNLLNLLSLSRRPVRPRYPNSLRRSSTLRRPNPPRRFNCLQALNHLSLLRLLNSPTCHIRSAPRSMSHIPLHGRSSRRPASHCPSKYSPLRKTLANMHHLLYNPHQLDRHRKLASARGPDHLTNRPIYIMAILILLQCGLRQFNRLSLTQVSFLHGLAMALLRRNKRNHCSSNNRLSRPHQHMTSWFPQPPLLRRRLQDQMLRQDTALRPSIKSGPAIPAPQTPAVLFPPRLASGSGTKWGLSTPSTPKPGPETRAGYDYIPSPVFEPLSPVLLPAVVPPSTPRDDSKASLQPPAQQAEVSSSKRKLGRPRIPQRAQEAVSPTPPAASSREAPAAPPQETETPAFQAEKAVSVEPEAPAEPPAAPVEEAPQLTKDIVLTKVKDEVTTPQPPTETGDTTADESITGRRQLKRRAKRKREESSPTPAETPVDGQMPPLPAMLPKQPTVPNGVMWTRAFNKVSGSAMEQIVHHRSANMFAAPIRDKDAPGYDKVILQPQDLKSIRAAINHGNRAAAQLAAALPGGDPGTSSVRLPLSEELVPPKGIINSWQLDRELAHMFANAIMYNPEHLYGLPLEFEQATEDARLAQLAGEEQLAEHEDHLLGYKVDEFGVVNDARAMFHEVDKLLTELRSAEIQRGSGPNPLMGTSTRQTSVTGGGMGEYSFTMRDEAGSAVDDADDQTATEAEAVGNASKRRRTARG